MLYYTILRYTVYCILSAILHRPQVKRAPLREALVVPELRGERRPLNSFCVSRCRSSGLNCHYYYNYYYYYYYCYYYYYYYYYQLLLLYHRTPGGKVASEHVRFIVLII